MVDKQRADQISGGVFLIGLAIMFMTRFWWPGILFVIGASSMARGIAEGRDWYSVPGGIWMIGLGLVFLFGFSLPMLLILIGVSMLLGQSWRSHEKTKRVIVTHDAPEKRKVEDVYYVDESETGPETTVEDLIDSDPQGSL